MPDKYTRWGNISSEDNQYLINHYNDDNSDIATSLNRTTDAVRKQRNKLEKLGLIPRKKRISDAKLDITLKKGRKKNYPSYLESVRKAESKVIKNRTKKRQENEKRITEQIWCESFVDDKQHVKPFTQEVIIPVILGDPKRTVILARNDLQAEKIRSKYGITDRHSNKAII